MNIETQPQYQSWGSRGGRGQQRGEGSTEGGVVNRGGEVRGGEESIYQFTEQKSEEYKTNLNNSVAEGYPQTVT